MEVKTRYACLSGAIRDGAKLRPQGSGGLSDQILSRTSCALVAAFEAMFGRYPTVPEYWAVPYQFNYLKYGEDVACPKCSDSCGIDSLIAHLNDQHGASREWIADWLETEEEKFGFVTVVETEALNIPEAGRGDSVVTEAQAGVLTKRF